MRKRRDKKGRVLRTGESQRADGRYVYVWTDHHKQHFSYSWKLEPGDRIPAGKRDCMSLREKEKQIQRDRMDGINAADGKRTLLEQVQRCVAAKDNVRQNTRSSYIYIVSRMEEDPFCEKRIDSIKQSDAREWAKKLKKKYRYSTVKKFIEIAGMAMDMAVWDDVVRKNPFDFKLTDVIVDDTQARKAWTEKQRDAFLKFCREEEFARARVDGFYILFHTGMRISEFCGLTESDIDFEKNVICINRQLLKKRGGGLYIEKTKTLSGTRTLPMTEEVAACFRRMIERRKRESAGEEIDGISGFLSFTVQGAPTTGGNWGYYLSRARCSYNACHREALPDISPHICRHTYCSIMAANGMNPKVLQYLMGHADMSVTMDIYTHVDAQIASREMKRLAEQAVRSMEEY